MSAKEINKPTHHVRFAAGVCITHLKATEMTAELSQQVMNDQRQLAQNLGIKLPWPSLLTLDSQTKITREALQLVSDPEMNYHTSASAFVTPTFRLRLLANMVTYLMPTAWPRKHFENKEVAVEWLLEQEDSHDRKSVPKFLLAQMFRFSYMVGLVIAILSLIFGSWVHAALVSVWCAIAFSNRLLEKRFPDHLDDINMYCVLGQGAVLLAIAVIFGPRSYGILEIFFTMIAVGFWLLPFNKAMISMIPMAMAMIGYQHSVESNYLETLIRASCVILLTIVAYRFRRIETAKDLRSAILGGELAKQSKLATVGKLTGALVHDIGNPTALIMLNANSLNKKNKDPKMETAILRIQKGAGRIDNILKDLRILNRAELEIHPRPTCVEDMINDSCEVLEERARVLEVKIECDFRLEKDVAVIDSNLIDRVLCNLLGNALDAYEPQETKQDRAIWIAAFWENDHLIISIEDQAGGIPADIRDKVFEPFFSTKQSLKGTGLGLFNVNQIVTSHRGRVDLESPEGGTRFVMRFPKCRQTPGAKAAS